MRNFSLWLGGAIELALTFKSGYDAEPFLGMALRVMEETMPPTFAPRSMAFQIGLLAGLIAIVDAAAQASPISYQYGGVITAASPSTGVAPGTPFSGAFSYDPANPSYAIGIEGFSQAYYGLTTTEPGSVAGDAGLTLQIGGQTILANPGGVAIATYETASPGQSGSVDTSGSPASPYTSLVISNSLVDKRPLQVALNLRNPTRALADSGNPYNLAEFPGAQLSVTLANDASAAPLYTGTIDSLVELTVPEPAFATLLCLFAIGWFARSRRRVSV
jgi:hypothetical protein